MDSVIKDYPAVDDGDLMLCLNNGVAYQRDMSAPVSYDGAYFNKCLGYEDQDIALKINAGRIALVDKYVGAKPVLDIGIGSGEFIKKRPNTFGCDINPLALAWLEAEGKRVDDFAIFRAFTFWDVIEHVEEPAEYFRRIANGSFLFTSLPIFDDLRRIRKSKHYRPNEHFYYWTERGFTDWMARYGFWLQERQDFEIKAGRNSILSFAFRKYGDKWPT